MNPLHDAKSIVLRARKHADADIVDRIVRRLPPAIREFDPDFTVAAMVARVLALAAEPVACGYMERHRHV